MKLRFKSVVAGVSALALAGVGVALATPASAWTGTGAGGAPSWYAGDTARKGAVTFHDANGNQITGGANINAVGTVGTAFGYLGTTGGTIGAGATRTNATLAAPDPANAIPANWAVANITPLNYLYATTPPAGLPAGPFLRMNALGAAYQDLASGLVLYPPLGTTTPNPEYVHVLEVRVKDNADTTHYWATDIEYNPSTATAAYDGLAPGEWRVVYPVVGAAPTTTTAGFTFTPPGTLDTNSSVTLTATVSPAAAAGTVQFAVDGSPKGGPVTVAAGSASLAGQSFTATTTPGHTITATFTPAVVLYSAGYVGSTGSTTSGAVTQVSGASSVVVTGPTSATVGLPASYTVTVNSGGSAVPAGSGSVSFSVNGAVKQTVSVTGSALTFSYVPVTADVTSATAPIVAPLAVTASFSSTSALYSNGTGNTVNTTVTAPAYTPDPQDVTVNVPAGTLVISTPYTATHPLSLGTMSLSSDGTGYTASAAFGDPAAAAIALNPSNWNLDTGAPTSNGVTVTDTRANGSGWNISVLANDFSGPAGKTISGNNLTFTNIAPKYITGNALQSGVTAPAAGVTAFGPGSGGKTFASLAPVAPATSTGTVAITALLGLTAPTSTAAGQYTATITFSIV